ncbi:MAG: multicopper oxidase domain-containing protein, partial [Actinomycetota bacterium]|nr:multicopper oxidase domain-containing protein [Actinomycetota bacterium]
MNPADQPGRRKIDYPITAIDLPIEVAPGLTDADGMIYVLSEEKDAVLLGTEPAQPLVIRANVGDCLRLLLTSEQLDANHDGAAKVNIHNHFTQFDPQASDGVITGFSYEQSVLPYTSEDRTLTVATDPGATQVEVSRVNRLRVGIAIGVGLAEGMCDATGQPSATPVNGDRSCMEIRHITAINGTTLTLDEPLINAHVIGEAVGVEFVQYEWFADVDDGTVFFHDHVDFNNWGHGLFGALIIEPAGSTWRDPVTGAEVRSGPLVDIHAPPTASVGVGQQGSFRELVTMIQNEMVGDDQLSGINGRTAPLAGRDPVYPFSSVTNDDPMTPLLRAYVGDDIVIRGLGVVEREGTVKVSGHAFQLVRFLIGGQEYDTVRLGISEREDLILESGAGGDAGVAGDFLIYNSVAKDLVNGGWGLMRVHDTLHGDLQVLPGAVAPTNQPGGFPQQTFTGLPPAGASGAGSPCAPGAPVRAYDVSVFENPHLDFDLITGGIMYALDSDKAALLAGSMDPEPLVVRANVGDCVEINLTNDLLERSGLTVSELLFDPQGSFGSAVGFNDDSTTASAATRTYRFYADEEIGTALFGDFAVFDHQRLGAFGAIVVEPAGSTWRDPATGAPIDSGVKADVMTPSGSFREQVMLFHEQDPEMGQDIMPYRADVRGFAGINYAAEPFRTPNLAGRLDLNPDETLLYSTPAHGDPDLLVEAYVGDDVRLRTGVGYGEGSQVFSLQGHRFPWEVDLPESHQLTAKG